MILSLLWIHCGDFDLSTCSPTLLLFMMEILEGRMANLPPISQLHVISLLPLPFLLIFSQRSTLSYSLLNLIDTFYSLSYLNSFLTFTVLIFSFLCETLFFHIHLESSVSTVTCFILFSGPCASLPSSVLFWTSFLLSILRESWTVKKAERRRIDASELWCWRRLLRVPGLQGDPTSPS